MSVEQVQEMMANLEMDDVQCHVCFNVNQEPVIFVTCNHRICAGCSARWLANCSLCPMCRTAVTEIVIDEDLKKKAAEYLLLHPEHELPNDIKWKQNCHETVFWAIQQRRSADDPEAVYFGAKPVPPEGMTDEQKKEYIHTKRSDNIWARVELLKERIGEQTEILKQMYKDEVRNQFFNDLNAADEDEEWQMVRGRGLIRVPRTTNRFYCPLRFRRSHSS